MGWLQDALTSFVVHPRRTVASAGAILMLGLIVALGVIGWVGSERAIHPELPEDLPRRAEFDLPLQDVTFLARDGTRLAGWFVPAAVARTRRAPTVVLMHGYGSTREETLPHAEYLHRAGYNALLFDFRASGESDGEAATIGGFEQEDALGALDYLEARGDIDMTRVGFQGISMGASVAIMAAAGDDRVAGVVAESPFKDVPAEIAASFEERIGLPAFPFAPITVWITEQRVGIEAEDIAPIRVVAGLERPLLIIENELDTSIAPGSARAVFEEASQPKRYWLALGSTHGDGHAADPAGYKREVLSFWAEVFGD